MANRYLKYKCTFFTELVVTFTDFSNQLLYMCQGSDSEQTQNFVSFPHQLFQTKFIPFHGSRAYLSCEFS